MNQIASMSTYLRVRGCSSGKHGSGENFNSYVPSAFPSRDRRVKKMRACRHMHDFTGFTGRGPSNVKGLSIPVRMYVGACPLACTQENCACVRAWKSLALAQALVAGLSIKVSMHVFVCVTSAHNATRQPLAFT